MSLRGSVFVCLCACVGRSVCVCCFPRFVCLLCKHAILQHVCQHPGIVLTSPVGSGLGCLGPVWVGVGFLPGFGLITVWLRFGFRVCLVWVQGLFGVGLQVA